MYYSIKSCPDVMLSRSTHPKCHASNYLIKKSAICTIIVKKLPLMVETCGAFRSGIHRLHFFSVFLQATFNPKWGHKNINNCAFLMTRFFPLADVFVLEYCGRFLPRRQSCWHWLKKITFRNYEKISFGCGCVGEISHVVHNFQSGRNNLPMTQTTRWKVQFSK